MTKRWNAPPQNVFFQEFTLKTIELNASTGYLVADILSVGGGLRGIFTDGTVKGNGTLPSGAAVSRDLEGDDFSLGYYLALALKPYKNISFAAVYRSKVTPDLEGDATLSLSGAPTYRGPASVEIVLPATFQLATAYTFRERAVFEFVYERTYWGDYKTLDFQYDSAPLFSIPAAKQLFDDPIPKNWDDSDTYRFGLTYHYNPAWTFLFGFGIDETPVPEATLNFELPDADALIYSTGFRYQRNEKLSFALAYLISDKENRTVTNKNLDGHFESTVHILNGSVVYRF